MSSFEARKGAHLRMAILLVMPGLVPGIHVLLFSSKDVDGRVKPGHDDIGTSQFAARFGGEAGHDLISVS
jgi:hypothetical protein